jgi:hypothetical protein
MPRSDRDVGPVTGAARFTTLLGNDDDRREVGCDRVQALPHVVASLPPCRRGARAEPRRRVAAVATEVTPERGSRPLAPALGDLVAEASTRVAPELFAGPAPRARVTDAYIEADAFVIEVLLDPRAASDRNQLVRLVAIEVEATIAPPGLPVQCRFRVGSTAATTAS